MSEKTFREFLKVQAAAKKEGKPIDWDRNRAEWLSSLETLYHFVEQALQKFNDQVRLTREEIELTEDHLGTYRAPMLKLQIGEQLISLIPVGTLLVATKGRVDVVGPRNTVRLVLVNEHAVSPGFGLSIRVGDQVFEEKGPKGEPEGKWVWKLSTPPPKIRFTELTPDTFFDALLSVING